MKDVRSIQAAAVRNAVFKEFGLQLPTNSKRNSSNVVEWKRSDKVRECYNKLYNEDDNAIENIARHAFLIFLVMMNHLITFMYILQLCAT